MKTINYLLLTLVAAVMTGTNLQAGTIFYQAIPSRQSDAGSGIGTNNQYTSAVDGGNKRGTDRVINGITLYALVGENDSATADNCTLNALSGSLSNAGGTSGSVQVDGVLKEVFSDMTFNNGATDGSQQEIVLDPDSLEEGVTYDLRVYVCNFSGQNRQVNLAFVGDGQAAVETGFFNEDDARTSGGAFSDPNQAYYIDYRYTWDGDSTPGVTITQRAGSAPFVLYALTNQIVPGATGAAAPVAPPPPPATGQALNTGMVAGQSDQVGVQSDDFYTDESLNNYGEWITIEKYGRCWVPTNCPPGWRPYVNGSWRYSDEEGWVFVSDEPWAWACYHYGRWIQVEFGCGWAWVPGTVWSGGWVSWRQGTDASCDCVAWAPLPPEVPVDWGVGVSTWVDEIYDIGPAAWIFVNAVDFGVDNFFGGDVIFGFDQVINVFNSTVNITNINYTDIDVNINIYNGGPDFYALDKQVRDHTGKGLDKVHVDHLDGRTKDGKHSELKGDHLATDSHKVKGDAKHPPKTKDHLASNKVNHGWKGVDKKNKDSIKNKMAHDSKGKNPKNTKANLPKDMADKAGKHHAGQQGAGTAGGGQTGGKGKHPGEKGKKGGGTEGLAGTQGGGGKQHAGKGKQDQTTGGTGAAGGFDQHPGKGKNKGQQGASGLTSGGQTGAGGFNQHPGKGKGKGATGAGDADTLGGQTAGAAGQTTGGKGGKHHPGQSLKGTGGQGGTQGAGAGTTAGTGGGDKGKHGKGGQKGLTGDTGQQGAGTGQGAGTSAGGKGKHGKGGQKGLTGDAGQQGAGTGQGATAGTTGGGKGKHGKGGQQGAGAGQGATTGTGGGSKGKHGKGQQGLTSGAGQQAGTGGATGGGGGKGKHGKGGQQSVTSGQPSGGGGGGGGKGQHKQQQSMGQKSAGGGGGGGVKGGGGGGGAKAGGGGGGGGGKGGGGGGGGKKGKSTPVPH